MLKKVLEESAVNDVVALSILCCSNSDDILVAVVAVVAVEAVEAAVALVYVLAVDKDRISRCEASIVEIGINDVVETDAFRKVYVGDDDEVEVEGAIV